MTEGAVHHTHVNGSALFLLALAVVVAFIVVVIVIGKGGTK